MDGFAWLVVIGIAIWLLSNSGGSKGSSSSSRSSFPHSDSGATSSTPNTVRPATNSSRTSNVIRDGFQPDDRCSCGGTWVKRENRETGGRFFSCSRYPKCKNSREQVLKARLGERYHDIYCSHGHHKPTSGTVFDYGRGKEVCKKCVDKGYLVMRSRVDTTSEVSERRSDRNQKDLKRNTNGLSASGVEKCRNGHPRTVENTYIRPDGSRECRVCKRNTR
jgi:ssDNA-binding Zn-finger/Zn-ribbon topoisomerase 1